MDFTETPKNKDAFPIITHITELYSGDDDRFEMEHMPRFEEITKRFLKIYGHKPHYYSRAPGKVNLSGDDIMCDDYIMLRVATEQDNIIAFSITEEDSLEIHHTMPTVHPPQKLSNDPNQKFSEEKIYTNLILAGYKAALCESNLTSYKGLKMVVAGNIPIGSGLGSSTSLIFCATMMALQANNLFKTTERKACLKKINKYEVMLS
jgi:galactokinase